MRLFYPCLAALCLAGFAAAGNALAQNPSTSSAQVYPARPRISFCCCGQAASVVPNQPSAWPAAEQQVRPQ